MTSKRPIDFPLPTGGQKIRKPASEHRFGEDLICRAVGCSRSWIEHQQNPSECIGQYKELRRGGPADLQDPRYDRLYVLCATNGISHKYLGELIGTNRENVSKALSQLSPYRSELAIRIRQKAIDLLDQIGVDLSEVKL